MSLSFQRQIVLAIEKCLMVTGESVPMSHPPPAPLLSSLGPVNVNPPPVYDGGPEPMVLGEAEGPSRSHVEDKDGSSAFVNSIIEVHHHHQHHHKSTAGGSNDAEAEAVGGAGRGAGNSGSGAHHGGNHMEHIEVWDLVL